MDQGSQPTLTNQNDANRRRFSDEQIKYLEFMFEAESRPESQLKEQLANELGLHPRQVSIWFQNRRARSKTKQIEREYNELKASYNALASSFESMQKENQSLLIKLQQMRQAMQHKSGGGNQNESSSCQESKSRHTNLESKEQNCYSLADYGGKEDILSTNQDSGKSESTREENEIINLTQHKDASIISSDLNSFEPNRYFNESSCSSQWWEF